MGVSLISASASYGSSGPSYPHSHTVDAGTSILLLKIGITGDNTISSVTWNGATADLLKWQYDSSAAGTRKNNSAIYFVKAPWIGTADVVVTTSAGTNVNVIAENYSGSDPANPLGTASGISASTSATAINGTVQSAVGDLCTDVAQSRYTLAPNAGQTQVAINGSSPYNQGASYKDSSGATTTMGWTYGNSGVYAATWIGVAIKPASGGGGTAVSLAVHGATHSQAAGNVSITASNTLVARNAAHAHLTGHVALSATVSLAVASALQAHQAEQVGIGNAPALSVQDGLHAHVSQSPSLSAALTLLTHGAAHGHSADVASLSAAIGLIIDSAAHAHQADTATLFGGTGLSINSASHAHTADTVTLSANLALAIHEALQAHHTDVVALRANLTLRIDNALQAHGADTLMWPRDTIEDLLQVASIYVRLGDYGTAVRVLPERSGGWVNHKN